ncbi:NitT/TauT family transport system substrate-binding protein [Lachnospiraceae bacterium MD308]|nr:NitT/TauT family transport system substrate-binding protein [Lachnospiraceae bacterium MD308]
MTAVAAVSPVQPINFLTWLRKPERDGDSRQAMQVLFLGIKICNNLPCTKYIIPFGADKTMTAVISGSADIGFMGSEASIYTYNEGANDYVVNFAQLTQRAGNFLVAREEMPDFKWEDLKGKDVLGGRKGGMPSHDVTWEHIRGIYEWTSRKAPDLKVFKYEEKVIFVS